MSLGSLDRLVQRRLAERGVYYGWVVVAACFVGATVTFGMINTSSVFFGPLRSAFGRSHAVISLVFSLQAIVTFVGAAVLGLFVDRYGVRRLLVVSTLLLGGGLLATSQMSTLVGVFLTYSVLTATGLSIVFVVSYTTPSRWFDENRGLATAIAASGGGVGILAGPPVSAALIGWVGWRGAYLSLAGVLVALLTAMTVVLADTPADLGVDVGGEFPDGQPATGAGRSWREQIREVLDLASTPAFGLICLGYLGLAAPIYLLTVHMVEFTTSTGVGRTAGILAMSVIGAMNIVGKFLAGPAADRIGTAHVLSGCCALMGGTVILLALARTAPAVVGLVVLFGVGYGGTFALLAPMLAHFFGTVNINTLFGLSNVGIAVSASVVPYVGGVTFDAYGTYVPALVGVGVVGLLAGVALEAAYVLASDAGPS